ncbi:FAD-dependent monooxygenase [Kineosporia sp. NBRC 101731]|uniref:FAD-dependent monooxygenase n=1 Tax=Kineosporia sp. NBRC 101731 TaxID=3032199 RepID=UPI0024A22B85|nr:FAD-dependent monooxygenase [Kineosporia sp. NBRC 101731]GLY32479.1 putative oxygenase [Kineosporia sp. NBRC 101731]
MPDHPCVLIVGAGPTGLMLAGELRLQGVAVTVIEQLASPSAASRAMTVHARTMEVFDQRGLLPRLGTPGQEPVGHFGGIRLRLDRAASPFPGQWLIPQTRTEQVLEAWAAGLGADVRRGVRLVGLGPGGPGAGPAWATGVGGAGLVAEVAEVAEAVEADMVDASGASVRMVADWVVGCDGENSTVRRLAGFELDGPEADRVLLRADITGIDLPERRFVRLSGGLVTSAKRPGGVTRIIVHEFGAKASLEPDFTEVTEAWFRVTGEDISSGEPVWVNAFGNAQRQATSYRRGRVLLAGDAAHQQMPIGGQAINIGLQDAVNLGWKLAAQVQGWAPPGLLDSYHDERHPVGAAALTEIGAQAMILLGSRDLDEVRSVLGDLLDLPAVQEYLSGRITALDVRYPVSDLPHRLLGARLPPTDLVTPDGPTHTAELLRSGRGLLLELGPDQARQKAGKWRDRVDQVVARAVPDLPAAVLIRPDGHVVWTDESPEPVEVALARWFGQPRETH